jgi:Na+/phosphate symporter
LEGDFAGGDDYLTTINKSQRRLIMGEERFSTEQVMLIAPIIDRLLTMMGAARDAFNRHSRPRVEELRVLQALTARVTHDMGTELKSLIARKSEDEQSAVVRAHDILPYLRIIGDNIGGCADPIEQKIRGAVLFSDKAVTQANFLFDQHSGMIRSVLDIIKTNNEFLKKYVLEESHKLGQACLTFATEHEERMIEGLCLPQAAPIFLSLLDHMRTIAQQEVEIANLLSR